MSHDDKIDSRGVGIYFDSVEISFSSLFEWPLEDDDIKSKQNEEKLYLSVIDMKLHKLIKLTSSKVSTYRDFILAYESLIMGL